MSARLEGFTGATHEALVLASAEARLTPAHLTQAGIDGKALEPAFRENVIELADGGVQLHASAARVGRASDAARLGQRFCELEGRLFSSRAARSSGEAVYGWPSTRPDTRQPCGRAACVRAVTSVGECTSCRRCSRTGAGFRSRSPDYCRRPSRRGGR